MEHFSRAATFLFSESALPHLLVKEFRNPLLQEKKLCLPGALQRDKLRKEQAAVTVASILPLRKADDIHK
jgi:hypothetical protein